jgi:nitroreductase/NAD-dependent dihydropyrimidine dehydrogenase PreA subunit
MLALNQDLCISCEKCVRICPFTCLQMDNSYPEMVARKEKGCIKCMHCVIACPTKAIGFENMPSEELIPMETPEVTYESLKRLVITRRSQREFQNCEVPKEDIREIIRDSDFAASAKNQHPQSWVVVYDQKVVKETMGLVLDWVSENKISMEILSEWKNGNNIVTFDAPHLLIGCAPKQGAINPYTDTTIALANIELLLFSKGIGSCWAGYLTRITNASQPIRELLGIGEDMQIFGILGFGYPKSDDYLRLPYRTESQINWR